MLVGRDNKPSSFPSLRGFFFSRICPTMLSAGSVPRILTTLGGRGFRGVAKSPALGYIRFTFRWLATREKVFGRGLTSGNQDTRTRPLIIVGLTFCSPGCASAARLSCWVRVILRSSHFRANPMLPVAVAQPPSSFSH